MSYTDFISKLRVYYTLTKPGISNMQLFTVSVGYFIGSVGVVDVFPFFFLLIGTLFFASSAAVFNHVIERDLDLKMERTQLRPLPKGDVSVSSAVLFGLFLFCLGFLCHFYFVNYGTVIISILTVFLYLFVYTPLKRVTWLNTFFGSFPGALPILGGWFAATGTLHFEAWILFLVLFTWQHPHFYALAIMYRDDYEKAGFKMLPVIDPDLNSTVRQSVIYTVLMILASIVPFFLSLSGAIYLFGVLFLGGYMLFSSFKLAFDKSLKMARRLFFASILYLPLWFLVIVLDFYFRL